MPAYKLTYFDLKGMGEPIRMLLTYLGHDFEDNRLKMEDWPTIKPTIRFGKIPVLDIDGKRFYQSQAIMRYLAKQAKLAGDNDLEAYEIDSIVGTIADFISAYLPLWGIKDPKEKEEFTEKIKNEIIPEYLTSWNEIVGNNGGYFANGKLSWADLFFFGYIETLEGLLQLKFVDNYPHLKKGREQLYSTPGVKEWIAKRPKTAL